jgi:hypothetical protein
LNNLLILCAEIAMLVRFSRVSPGRRWICQKVTPVLRGLVKKFRERRISVKCLMNYALRVKLFLFIDFSMATRQLFCVDDWAQLESNKQRGFYLGSRGHFRLPKCEKLPRIGSRSFFMSSSHSGSKYGQDPPSCSRAHLTQLVPAEVTSESLSSSYIYFYFSISFVSFFFLLLKNPKIHQLRASKDAVVSIKET